MSTKAKVDSSKAIKNFYRHKYPFLKEQFILCRETFYFITKYCDLLYMKVEKFLARTFTTIEIV